MLRGSGGGNSGWLEATDDTIIAITGRSCRLKDHVPLREERVKTERPNPNPTNPQNRRAEWLAFRFCSFYFAADRLWTALDFHGESAILARAPGVSPFHEHFWFTIREKEGDRTQCDSRDFVW
jgi:hypothetical protein